MSAQQLLEMVGRVGAAAADTASVTDLLDTVVAEVAVAAGFAVGHAYRFENGAITAGGTWWVRPGLDVEPLRVASRSETFLAGMGLPGQTLGSGAPTWFPDLAQARALVRRETALACGLGSAVAFPALVGRRVVAVLEFFATGTRPVDEQLAAAFTTIGLAIGQVFERIEAHEDQWIAQNHAQMILDNAGDAFVAIDGDGTVVGWNREAERMYGYPASEAIGRSMPELIMPEEYRADHDTGIARYKAIGHGHLANQYVELEALRKGGERFPIEMAFWGLNQQGRWHFYSFARDITERKVREAALEYRSSHDALTGLPNRAAAVAHIDAALAATQGESAVLLLDLDRYKITRERLGHETTDALLIAVAGRLADALPEGDWLARVADDEFVVLHRGDAASATAAAHRLITSLAAPFALRDDRVTIGASAGVVVATPDLAGDADDLIRDAGAGLSVGRAQLRGEVKVFDRGRRGLIHRRLATERDLEIALADGQLRLHYQPVVRLADQTVVGVEALVRWQHPTRGLLAPAAFIDVAEESGLIVPLGSFVIAEACRQAAAWQAAGARGFSVAVNLSARQFGQSGLVDEIVRQVRGADLDRSAVAMVFEVTESMLMNDPAAAKVTLDTLAGHGFSIFLDDFGTGYSSMAYLKTFAVNTIKIDRSFVIDIDTDPRDRAIVAAITGLGHALGLDVLAEGIETAAQRDRLIELGCDYAQGYFFGRPTDAARIEAPQAGVVADAAARVRS